MHPESPSRYKPICTALSSSFYVQAFGSLNIIVLAILIVWMILFYVYDWNDHMPTPSILKGLISGVVEAIGD